MKKNVRLACSEKQCSYSNSIKTKCFIAILCLIFSSIGVLYAKEGGVVLSKNATFPSSQANQQSVTVTGTVKDDMGEPLPGVTVVLKSDKKRGVTTDMNGKYSFSGVNSGDRLLLSYIGMEPTEVAITAGKTVYNVTMKYSSNVLDEVVIETGIFQRDKVSFTGAISSYSATELKSMGNSNLLESLKSLDPAFVVIDSQEFGSNPNITATIELRGQGSATVNAITDEFSSDPNQPLFVINGVESSFSRFKDLDINRVESITILKDASSTAIYGSKGANGVVVVETIKPKSGEIRLYYNGDFNVQMPDLGVYNLMNSAEKLEFERLAGKYYEPYTQASNYYADYQKALTDLYYSRLVDVLSGVDTYWLSEPVHTAFTHGHSIRINGGDQVLSFDIGGKYKIQEGVMKASGRDTWAGDVGITYRKGKFIISNALDISGYTATESPYGDFSDWANVSPYFKKRNEEGFVDKFLQKRDEGSFIGSQSPVKTNVPNPLWNAGLNSKNETTSLEIVNSLSIQYKPIEPLRFRAGADLSTTRSQTVKFTPPEHTKFHDLSEYYQGRYYEMNKQTSMYRGWADVSFSQIVKELHSFTLMARGQLRQTKNNYTSIDAEGFPYGSKGSPNLAHSYKEESSPGYSFSDRRSVSFTSSFNYNFAKRYLFDFTYSMDGATTFGSNKLYKSFWSTGIGWNIDKEAFMEGCTWIDQLKLRATTGESGNQNQGSTVSETVYRLYTNSNVFGQGLYISDFANPDLPWQTARDYGVGIDFRTRGGQILLTVDYYHSKTNPNIIFVPQIPSTGITIYPMPLGHLIKKGYEFTFSINPIHNLKKRIIWGIKVTGLHSKSTYGGLGNVLGVFNENQRKDNTLVQYRDGYSPSDIWAVRSYGIDPADGEEIFIKKNGELTKIYNTDDIVKVGNNRPDLTGVLNTNFRYKNFQVNVSFRYSFGGYTYNTALYNKVENITKEALQYNQDKRALYDRWKTVGDLAKYKSISIVSSESKKTSRFVQKDNYLRGESISATYEINNNEWLRKNLSVKSLKITGYLNDIFRLETSKTERGINYPFARTVSLGLNLSF